VSRTCDLAFIEVSHHYRRRSALESVTLEVNRGFTGLLGPNGAGKSTLLNLAATALPLQSGHLLVGGHDVSDTNGRRRARQELGYLPQHFDIAGSMRVVDAVEYAAWAQGVADGECQTAGRDALELVDLVDLMQQRVRHLSGGQRQRLGIACALAHNPSILLLDEPTAGLDPEQRSSVRQHLTRLAKERTILMATHILEDVARFGDRLVVLNQGRVLFDGPPTGLAGGVGGLDAIEHAYLSLVRQL
jgi:ABC-2 type transport system ATP-binding protein